MDIDGGIRASDSDRESVVEVLRAAYTDGRLNLDEFVDRTTAAYAARTWADLRELASDLPTGVHLGRQYAARPMAPLGISAQPGRGGQVPPARRPGLFPVLPLVILFAVLAGSSHAAALAVVPALVVVMVCLRMTGRRCHGGRPGARGDFPPGPGSSPPPGPGGSPPPGSGSGRG